ncbi:MAG TPA: rhodanese-related sulfurtransferase [Candidatus Saccharimonadia bacterium]
MQKIILYYKFAPVPDPQAVMLWQKTLCESLGLKGRIIISKQGINGTLGGDVSALKKYAKATKLFQPFKGTVFKWSAGTADHFPKLSVKVRDEIVTFGAADEIRVDEHGVVGGGQHLSPADVHKLVKERGGDVVFFDGRNVHEAAIGRFKNAVIPNVGHTREFREELKDAKYDAIKKKPVVTYCTGGIRCEVLSVLMKNRGFQEVYQIDGGIVKYGETYKNKGLWEGSLRVFDDRMNMWFGETDDHIANCMVCGSKTSNQENCSGNGCRMLTVICEDCLQAKATIYCSPTCTSLS